MSLIMGQVIPDQWLLSALEIEKLNFSSLFGIYFHCYPVLLSCTILYSGERYKTIMVLLFFVFFMLINLHIFTTSEVVVSKFFKFEMVKKNSFTYIFSTCAAIWDGQKKIRLHIYFQHVQLLLLWLYSIKKCRQDCLGLQENSSVKFFHIFFLSNRCNNAFSYFSHTIFKIHFLFLCPCIERLGAYCFSVCLSVHLSICPSVCLSSQI